MDIRQAIETICDKFGGVEMESFLNISNEDTTHHVKHSFKETIIVPLIGVSQNITFLFTKGQRYLIFSDGLKGKVTSVEKKNIFDMEEDVKDLYGIDLLSFIKKWRRVYAGLDSMEFLKINCKKE